MRMRKTTAFTARLAESSEGVSAEFQSRAEQTLWSVSATEQRLPHSQADDGREDQYAQARGSRVQCQERAKAATRKWRAKASAPGGRDVCSDARHAATATELHAKNRRRVAEVSVCPPARTLATRRHLERVSRGTRAFVAVASASRVPLPLQVTERRKLYPSTVGRGTESRFPKFGARHEARGAAYSRSA